MGSVGNKAVLVSQYGLFSGTVFCLSSFPQTVIGGQILEMPTLRPVIDATIYLLAACTPLLSDSQISAGVADRVKQHERERR